MHPSQRTFAITAVILCAGAAAAWQTALSSVGWSEQRAAEIAESFFTTDQSLPDNGSISPAVKSRWIVKSPAERALAIRELALYAKKYVQAAAFEKTYNGWIAEHYHAVNHGLKVNTPAAAEDMNAAMSEMASEMAKAFGQLDATGLRMLLTNDIDSVKDSQEDSDKKMLARYRRIEGLLKTNLPEARKQYAIAKSMQLSGAADEAQAQASMAAGEKAAAERKRMDEQRAWDEHNLKTELRRRLAGFVKTAESIDFSAQTQRNAGKLVFVNPEFERKPSQWKLLYRLGKEPTLAAVDVAKQWLREL
jgi:hypothetical protein